MIRLGSSNPHPRRQDVLLGDLVKAAHTACWAEDAFAWHCDLSDAKSYELARDQAVADVQRVLMEAQREGILDASGVHSCLGVVHDTLTMSRWLVDRPPGVPEGLMPTKGEQMANLPRVLRRSWSHAMLRKRIRAWLRMAS